jgi:hypothetical protein
MTLPWIASAISENHTGIAAFLFLFLIVVILWVVVKARIWVRYIYFMRFSITLWLFLILLPILDAAGISTSITHVMFAISGLGQFVAVGFYTVLTGWIALLSARVVCAYGPERFESVPPKALEVGGDMSWKAFFAAQVPGFCFLAYTAVVSAQGSLSGCPLLCSSSTNISFCTISCNLGQLLLGGAFAFFAWYLVAFFYSILRNPPAKSIISDAEQRFSDPTFRAFVMPRADWLLLDIALKDRIEPPFARWAIARLGKLAKVLGPGYEKMDVEPPELHTGHVLIIILYLLLLLIYMAVGFFTWPRLHTGVPALLLSGIALILLFWVMLAGTNHPKGRFYRIILGEFSVMVGLLFYWAVSGSDFAVLASIMVLVHSLYWIGFGFAFWGDRFRIPVLTLLFSILVLGSNIVSLDHIYETLPVPRQVSSSTPYEIVLNYAKTHDGEPMIVVTASGGGIHSAAWTATVLNGLEGAFGSKGFHQHVVLISSVSGGSVAASNWAELYLDRPLSSPLRGTFPSRVRVAECSSLESAAWGVLYPDLGHLLIWKDLLPPLLGLEVYDRGWALQTAFARNLGPNCEWYEGARWMNGLPTLFGRYQLTTLRDATTAGDSPAFAFNTTLVNGGRRFLLSTYHLPPARKAVCHSGLESKDNACPPDPVPTLDFLSMCPDLDLSLFTVARLSATFPYVTPVAIASPPRGAQSPRLEGDTFCYQQHLADGGYYDDDGMDTAMEFLWSAYGDGSPALGQGVAHPDSQPNVEGQDKPKELATGLPRHIYLIEIRNADEPDPRPTPPKPPILGHIVEQITSPITTLFGAWENAQPIRNQQEFRGLEYGFRGRVRFDHLVFAFKKTKETERDPESWHLTARDKKTIESEWKDLYGGSVKSLARDFK